VASGKGDRKEIDRCGRARRLETRPVGPDHDKLEDSGGGSTAQVKKTTSTQMDTIIALGGKAGLYFIAATMAIFGVQHFIYLRFVAEFIPAWIPWRVFWACFTGLALIAAAVGIVLRKWDRWAATLLGSMIFLWVILLHTSRVAANPHDPGEWRGIFQALAMSGFAFVLAGTLAGTGASSQATRSRFGGGMNVLAELGTWLGPYFIAVSMLAFGVQHFIFAEATTPQVPAWIPGTVFGNYLSGTALFATGVGLLFQRTARMAAALLGVLIFLSVIFIHAPIVIASPRFESDWCKALVISGGAFLLAGTLPKAKQISAIP
jgi:uncharacterized membrane protein